VRLLLLVALLGCGPGAAPRNQPSPLPSGIDAAPAIDAVAAIDAAPATAASDAALPPGCRRQRLAHQGRCSGVAPRPGEPDGSEVRVCDECLADADCQASAGGRCLNVDGHPCSGPARLACRYPSPACGGSICPERQLPYPPSAAPGR
jgi:hypothetical protein